MYQQQHHQQQQPAMPYPQQPMPGKVPAPQPSYNGGSAFAGDGAGTGGGDGVYQQTPEGYTRPGAGQRTSARGGRRVSYKVTSSNTTLPESAAAALTTSHPM